MTLAELEIILSVGFDYQEELVIRHADLKTAILNAPRVEREGHGLFKITDFLPEALKSKITEISEEEQVKRIYARGEALAAKCREKFKKS
ncbi:MAG: hypothetical protein PHF61_11330 [Bacteroidales bacterium]|jgi:hypothetical protein|nr:hypothetical protein [Bacteroidales bacterium]